jgi:uncharacterized protein
MRTKLLHESDGLRTLAVALDTGEEVLASLKEVAAREKLTAAQVSAIGAFSDATLGYFDWEKKEYLKNPVKEQVEVVAMLGDIGEEDGKPALHVHLVLGRRDGTALGGHLLEAHVRPTLEVIITESPAHLRRRKDAETGLALIRF